MTTGTLLEKGCVVHHDRVATEPLALVAGRVAAGATSNTYRIDLRGHLIFPGLVNAHDHLQLNNIPPLPHTQPFANSYAWIDAFEPHRRTPDVVAAVGVASAERHWLGGLKNALAGVTTVAHHDPWHDVLDDPGFPVGLLRQSGWSHSLGLGAPVDGRPPRYGPGVPASFRATSGCHPWVIHLAEGTDDVARGELDALDALGCLAANTVLVHGVGLSHADAERVIERGAAVVWCPTSNLGILGRTLHRQLVRRLFAAGRLALGSDSRLTGARDLLGELRAAAANSDLAPRELLRLVTADACRILRLPDCGSLQVGQRADCVIVRGGGDPFEVLRDATRGQLRAVVRGGVPVIADPDFAPWFAHCGVDVVAVHLDGRPKLLARSAALPAVVALEPGLEPR